MQFATALLALASVAVAADSCQSSYAQKFAISVVKPSGSSKRDLEMAKRAACSTAEGSLTISLQNGVLTDEKGRTGYIASNYQFQFDGPPQADHMQVSGFSICGNNLLGLDGSTDFFQCLSGNFYNLYNKNWASQCKPVNIQAVACDGTTAGSGSSSGNSSSSAAPAPSAASPAPSASSASAPAASQINDGQPQSPSAAPQVATGGAASYGPQIILAAAGLAGAALL